MSTRKRLESLTADLTPVPARPETMTPTASAALSGDGVTALETRFPLAASQLPVARTGPGQMLAFRGQMLAAEAELTSLRTRLAQHEGALATRRLDPDLIAPSRWCNRHPATFSSPAFVRLKSEIEHASGNVQPVLVRPIADAVDRYELIFGHRRHRACQELKLPVLAAIWSEPLADDALFALMDRENRERADLSPYEQGLMYLRALDEHLYPSQRRLAEALGVSHTWVRKALTVAQLPSTVVECFANPLEIQHRHAELINAAVERDRRAVLKRAERLRGQRLPAARVVAQLTEAPQTTAPGRRELRMGDKVIGSITQDPRGATTIALKPGALTPDRLTMLLDYLTKWLADPHQPLASPLARSDV